MLFRKLSFQSPTASVTTEIVSDIQTVPNSKPKFIEIIKSIYTSISKVALSIFNFVLKPFKALSDRRNTINSQVDMSQEDRRLRSSGGKSKVFSVIKVIVLVLVFVGLSVAVLRIFSGRGNDSSQVAGINQSKRTYQINQNFDFPVVDQKGKEITKIKYELSNAEITDEIVVQGQKATAIKGRVFLIINLKLTNDYSKAISLNAKDYVRLSVNGNKDNWLAPEIHNDPVEVQAISTKITRVGFPINETDSNLVLRMGEIDGEKSEIEIFK